jgi:hypothetical protein
MLCTKQAVISAYDEPSALPEETPTDAKTEAVSKRDSQEGTSYGSDDPPLAGWRGAVKKFGDNTYKIWDEGVKFDENAQ